MKKILFILLFAFISLFVSGQKKNPIKLEDSSVVTKFIQVDYSGAYVFSQPGTITISDTYDVDETVYSEGTQITTSGYQFVNLYLEKTASTEDKINMRVSAISNNQAYQQTAQSQSIDGIVSIEPFVYQFSEDAGTYTMLIPISGAKTLRLDMIKATDAGTASTIETQISLIK